MVHVSSCTATNIQKGSFSFKDVQGVYFGTSNNKSTAFIGNLQTGISMFHPNPPFPPFPFPSENNLFNSHSLIQIILTSTPGNCSTATSAWLLSQLQGLGNRTALKLTNHSFLGTSLRTNIGSFFTLQSSFPFDCG